MRKKLNEHDKSIAHKKAVEILSAAEVKNIETAIDKLNARKIESTVRVFNTVYSLAKRNRPMSDITDEIDLQVKNGVDCGICLHSRYTATKIVSHISVQLRKQIFSQIIAYKSKMCIILDEASTVAKLSTLIVYLRCEIPTAEEPVNVFVDLVELESTTAESVINALLDCLKNWGFDNNYLQDSLIGYCSDGASTMLGRNSGVAARLNDRYPNIIIWHCLCHRVQLALDDAIKGISQVNHFKAFLDKLYSLYHQSNKNQAELHQVANDLGLGIQKVGRVFGPRWVACSVRSAKSSVECVSCTT